jgi:ABC-2 type transport system ATP-binding protein
MTRRIGVAQALINDPELVLLDEPTSGLDPIGTREMKNLIIELKERGKTVVLCSHLLADVEDVCDRIAVLHQGELKELGRVGDLLRVTDITQIRARGLSSQAVEQIRGILAAEQAAEVEIGNPNTTLEDLFLEIVKDTQARPGRRAQPQAAAASESQHSESRSPSHGA